MDKIAIMDLFLKDNDLKVEYFDVENTFGFKNESTKKDLKNIFNYLDVKYREENFCLKLNEKEVEKILNFSKEKFKKAKEIYILNYFEYGDFNRIEFTDELSAYSYLKTNINSNFNKGFITKEKKFNLRLKTKE